MKKRADGRYQRKLLLPSGRTRTVYGRTLAELKRAEDLARDEDRAGLKVGDTTTVAQWAAMWLQTYKGDLRPNTVRMYQSTLALHILPQIGTLQVRDLRPLHCQAILRSVADQSESLQSKVRLTLRQLCKAARLNGLMLRDPTEGLTITPQPKPEKMPCLSQADAAALVQAVRQLPDKRAAALVGLCLYCGLRREEALGIQWGDIKGSRLTVTRAVTHAGGNQPDRSMRLKSDAARRVLPGGDPCRNAAHGAVGGPGHERRPHHKLSVSVPVAQGAGRLSGGCASAHAAAYIRHHPVPCGRRSAHGPEAAGTCIHHHDRGRVHSHRRSRYHRRSRADRSVPCRRSGRGRLTTF